MPVWPHGRRDLPAQWTVAICRAAGGGAHLGGGAGFAPGGSGLMMLGVFKHVYQGWMWVGHVMGWVNTRIILGVLLYGVVTPMGWS